MERRTVRRSRLGASAAVELANQELIPVEVVDISAEGARLNLATGIPTELIVAVLLGGRRYPSSVVWAADSQLGVAFDGLGTGEDPVLQAVANVMADLERQDKAGASLGRLAGIDAIRASTAESGSRRLVCKSVARAHR